MLMAVSLHQYHHSLLVHSAQSLSVKMLLFMWRALNTESQERDRDLILQLEPSQSSLMISCCH